MRYTICMIKDIEDCLEHLAGFRESPVTFTIESTDFTIVNSIARQVFRGTALTDRQLALMQEKLQPYREQFTNLDWDFDFAIGQLRQPLRSIDRSKYIKIQDDSIVVRFPFKKSDIVCIQSFSLTAEGYSHKKGSHQHSFAYNEVNVMHLLTEFSATDFTIDQELIDVYKAAKEIHNTPQDYLSGIFNNKLVNIKSSLAPIIQHEVGALTDETFAKFIDRRFRYGLDNIDVSVSDTHPPMDVIARNIITRKGVEYHSRPSEESTHDVLTTLWNLDRFPLLVVLDIQQAEQQLYELANYYRDILNPEEQSVLFRLEDKNAGFNQLVKDRKLNNWVDKTTKVVYISKSKLPKLLINSEWIPNTCIAFDSAIDRTVSTYITSTCDLVVFREEYMSPFRRHSKIYG